MIFDKTICQLGEGPLWHPKRESLFWFDILGKKLYERSLDDKEAKQWQFDEYVSAAGWVDKDHLLIASQTALTVLNLNSGKTELVHDLEKDNVQTRSNDGRADPYGGFWIGTMGINAEPNAGAIYRYYLGELKMLIDNVTISNSICFSPDGKFAYYCDTPTKKIMKIELDDQGWPVQKGKVLGDLFADVSPYNPDGSVVDSRGFLYSAQWGSKRIAVYNEHGILEDCYLFDASQVSCPAIGGKNLDHLFVTSAAVGLSDMQGDDGQVFFRKADIKGQTEHQVFLG